MAGKSKQKKKRGEQFSVQSGNDFRAAKYRENGLPAEIFHSPEIAFISKETKEAKRLKRTKKAKKSRSREEKRLNRSKQIEKMGTNEQSKLKEQRNHKGRNARSLKQQRGDDTNYHSEDKSILNSEATGDIAIEPSISLQQISKPKKETRIVPVKIGSSWTFKTISESDPKFNDAPQENHSLSGLSSILPMKRGPISLTSTGSGCNETHRKRVKITTEKEENLIPTPGARHKCTAGEFKSQQGNILINMGEELADNQNGRQSPTFSSTTNTSSTSWSDRPLIETLRESRGSNQVHSDGTVDPGRRATRKEKCEQVADIWQENPGKIRGRLGTSEDMEVEENLAFSAHYLAVHPMGVTISGMNFRTVTLAPGSKFVFGGAEDATLRIASVGQGTLKVKMCNTTFSLQMGGMWRLRGPERCSLKNCGFGEAIVHVSSIKLK